MSEPADSLAVRCLRLLARAVCRFPRTFFYPQILLFFLCTFYTVERLQFSTSRNDLVGADKKYHRNFLEFKKEFGAQDDLVAVVESEDHEKNRQFVERLGVRLEAETNLFSDVFYKGDLKALGPKALMFLEEEKLQELRQTLADYRPFLQQFSSATNLLSLFKLVNHQFRNARPEQNDENAAMVKAMPALTRIVAQAADCLSRAGTPPSPGLAALFGGGEEAEQSQYITFAHSRIYLVTARAKSESLNGDAVDRLRELVRLTQAEVPGLNVGITGEPVLELDEMKQSQRDTTVATIVSFVLVILIFVYGYAETGRPIKATISLVVGLGYTMGFTTLVVGHLNILTITFAPILIGLAIDFGVHLITRYEEELRHGRSEFEAMEKAVVNTGLGIFTGCTTTAAAFLAMGATNFRGIQEMGIISGGGLLICLVPMMTMLPVLLLRGRQNVLDHQPVHIEERRARVERIWLERPWTVVGLTTTSVAVCVALIPRVYFDYNLLHMQSKGLPAVVLEKKLLNSASKSVLFGAVVADSLDEAGRLEHILTNLPTVGSVESMTRFLNQDQSGKANEIRDIKAEVNRIRFAPADHQLVDTTNLTETLTITQGYLTWAIKEVLREAEHDTNHGVWLYTADDILDAEALAKRFHTTTNLDALPWWKPLVQEVESIARQTNMPSAAVRAQTAAALNRRLTGGELYSPELFAGVDLSVATRARLERSLTDQGAVVCNRVLLDSLFPAELGANLPDQLRSLGDALLSLVRGVHRDHAMAGEKLASFQKSLFRDIHETFQSLGRQDERGPMRPADLPVSFRSRFVGQTGKLLLQVYPNIDVWQRENQDKFVHELRRALDPKGTDRPIITGTPVQLYEYTSLLVNSYVEAAGYAVATIAVLVFIHFRSFVCVLLSLLPVAIGSLWTIGLMVWLDLPFNPANIMTLPLVVGVGVTNGIHILNRFAEEHSPSILARSTGKAVIVSALTTVAGFGSLVLADHQGIKSLGLIMAVGTAACMMAALVSLPALLHLLGRAGWRLRSPVQQKTQ